MTNARNLRNAITAGVIALVIYVVIALLTGAGFGSAVEFGVLLGIFTFAVSLAVYTLIMRAKAKNA